MLYHNYYEIVNLTQVLCQQYIMMPCVHIHKADQGYSNGKQNQMLVRRAQKSKEHYYFVWSNVIKEQVQLS